MNDELDLNKIGRMVSDRDTLLAELFPYAEIFPDEITNVDLNTREVEINSERLSILSSIINDGDLSMTIDSRKRKHYLLIMRRLLELLYTVPEKLFPKNFEFTVENIVFLQELYEMARKFYRDNISRRKSYTTMITDDVLTGIKSIKTIKTQKFDPEFLAWIIDQAIEDECDYMKVNGEA